ncbi:hypothetical protein BT69DRAFT_1332092 [Atractiella rhizophila]|nr:hypothetical protein BT69DRAFT_1332092 [Atractiella rhizophila]
MSPSTSSSPNSDRLSLEEEHDRDRSGKRRSFSGWGKKICNPSSSSSTSPSSSPKVVPLRQDIFAFDTTSVSSFSSTSTSTSIFKDTPVLIPPSLPAAKDIPISPILRPPGQTSSTTARLMWEERSLLRREKGKGKEEIGEDEDPTGPVSGVVMETSGFVCKCQRVLGIVYAIVPSA